MKAIFRVVKKTTTMINEMPSPIPNEVMISILTNDLPQFLSKFEELKKIIDDNQNQHSSIDTYELGEKCFEILDFASDKLYEYIENHPLLSVSLKNRYGHHTEFSLVQSQELDIGMPYLNLFRII